MTEKLIIKNFGPIKEAEIDLRKVNIFIGPTGSGKSVAAKLVSIFRSKEFQIAPTKVNFNRLLLTYNIDFPIIEETSISFHSKEFIWTVSKESLVHNADKLANDLALIPLVFALEKSKAFGVHVPELYDWVIDKSTDLEFTSKEKTDPLALFIRFFTSSEGLQELTALIERDSQITELVFVPAERILFAMTDSNSFSFLQQDSVRLPEFFKEFGSMYQAARLQLLNHELASLDIEYRLENGQDYVVMKDKTKFHLRQASSGVQSTVPLELVFKNRDKKRHLPHFYLVEEPEMNLFPTAQKKLTEFMVESINKAESDQLILTTHSPYVVTAVANLVLAGETGKMKGRKTKVKAIVPENQWLDYDSVSCYQFENGTVKDLRDDELGTIDGNAIDDVSEEMSSVFHQLLELKYP